MNFFDIENTVERKPLLIEDLYKKINKKADESFDEYERFSLIRMAYIECFLPRMRFAKEKGWVIKLSPDELSFINDFSRRKTEAKNKEWGNVDSRSRSTRDTTGAKFEFGCLKYYGHQKDFDNDIVEHSFKKDYPDLQMLGILSDVKACHPNSVPLIKTTSFKIKSGEHEGKRFKCSNIIGVVDDYMIYILGIATTETLGKYVSKNLNGSVTNPEKIGFYGAEYLINLPSSWEELTSFCNSNIVAC